VSAGTLAQGATLRFDRAPAELQCLDCGRTFSATDHTTSCPACLGPRVKTVHGDMVRVDSIDVE
jgi:Zn finger protein HypA/HybF involved in hydrogenase expression